MMRVRGRNRVGNGCHQRRVIEGFGHRRGIGGVGMVSIEVTRDEHDGKWSRPAAQTFPQFETAETR